MKNKVGFYRTNRSLLQLPGTATRETDGIVRLVETGVITLPETILVLKPGLYARNEDYALRLDKQSLLSV